jgi:hypothetical protein
MPTVDVIVAIVTILANAAIGVADLVRADFVLTNSAKVDVPRSWLPILGVLKLAGAAGLLLGLLWVPVLGIAAATGLVAFYTGAVAAHVRARVLRNIAFPGAYLALAVASLVLAVMR